MIRAAVVALICVGLLALWQIAASRGWINGQLFGSPLGIYNAAYSGLTQGSLVSDTLITLYETLVGLAIGSLLGTGLGLLLWFLPAVSGVAEGFSILLNSIPKIALGPAYYYLVRIGHGIENLAGVNFDFRRRHDLLDGRGPGDRSRPVESVPFLSGTSAA